MCEASAAHVLQSERLCETCEARVLAQKEADVDGIAPLLEHGRDLGREALRHALSLKVLCCLHQ